MDILWLALIGLCAGWLAGQLTKGSGFGVWGNLIVGVIGAFLGGFTLQLLGITAYGLLGRLVVATLGAVLLLWLLKFVKH